MARIQYNLTPFNRVKAMAGKLCVIVDNNYSGASIYNITETGAVTTSFHGVGICKYREGDFILTYNGEDYAFTPEGLPSEGTPSNYVLKMGKVATTPPAAGESVNTKTVATTEVNTRAGTISDTTVNYNGNSNVLINATTPRDEFAMQALRGILSHVEDPASLSDSEMNYFCEQAYQWAANMMSAAANARGSITDNTPATEETEPVQSLSSNTEKLLNNISIQLGNIKTSVDNIDGGGGGGSSSGEVDILSMPTVDIGNNGLGSDVNNPIYISGGGFPSRDVLASAFTKANIHDILTFNALGAVGYSPLTEFVSLIDDRIKLWLQNTTVTVDGVDYNLNVPTSV